MKRAIVASVLLALGLGSWLGYAATPEPPEFSFEGVETPVPPPLGDDAIIPAPSGEEQLRQTLALQPEEYKFAADETVALFTPALDHIPAHVKIIDFPSLSIVAYDLNKKFLGGGFLDKAAYDRTQALIGSSGFDAFLEDVAQ